MTSRAVLAIDQGTSGTKALLLGEDGTVLDTATYDLGQSVPGPGMVEQDPERLWASVRGAVADLMARHDEHLLGIALSTQRESVLAWDVATGRPASALISWQDRRTASHCAKLLAEHPTEITAISGLPVDPMFSATKAEWLLHNDERLREAADHGAVRVGCVDGWLLKQLTGQDLCEIGNAARTQLVDITATTWSRELLELFNIPPACLPRIAPSLGEFGCVSGLPGVADGTPVVAVAGDSHAALYAQSAGREDIVKATYGSGSSLMSLTTAGCDHGGALARTIAWQEAGAQPRHALEGNIAAAGTAVRWVRDLLGLDDDGLHALAAEWPEGDVPVLVPAFNGLGAPYWDREARAVLVGFSQATTPAELVRAAVESIAFQINDTLELIDLAVGESRDLRTDGGASTNDQLMQFQADLSAREVVRSACAANSALGAAYMAGTQLGLWHRSEIVELGEHAARFRPSGSTTWRSARRAEWRDGLNRARN